MSEVIFTCGTVDRHKIIRQGSKSYRPIMHLKRKTKYIKSLILEAKERRFSY